MYLIAVRVRGGVGGPTVGGPKGDTNRDANLLETLRRRARRCRQSIGTQIGRVSLFDSAGPRFWPPFIASVLRLIALAQNGFRTKIHSSPIPHRSVLVQTMVGETRIGSAWIRPVVPWLRGELTGGRACGSISDEEERTYPWTAVRIIRGYAKGGSLDCREWAPELFLEGWAGLALSPSGIFLPGLQGRRGAFRPM